MSSIPKKTVRNEIERMVDVDILIVGDSDKVLKMKLRDVVAININFEKVKRNQG